MILTFVTECKNIVFDNVTNFQYYSIPLDLDGQSTFDELNKFINDFHFGEYKQRDFSFDKEEFREKRAVGFTSNDENYIITYDCECYLENDKGKTIGNYSLRHF